MKARTVNSLQRGNLRETVMIFIGMKGMIRIQKIRTRRILIEGKNNKY